MYSYGPPHITEQKQDEELEPTFSSSVRIRDVALRTYQKRWMIGRSGERWSGISVLAARHDDDDDDIHICRKRKIYPDWFISFLHRHTHTRTHTHTYTYTHTHTHTHTHIYIYIYIYVSRAETKVFSYTGVSGIFGTSQALGIDSGSTPWFHWKVEACIRSTRTCLSVNLWLSQNVALAFPNISSLKICTIHLSVTCQL